MNKRADGGVNIAYKKRQKLVHLRGSFGFHILNIAQKKKLKMIRRSLIKNQKIMLGLKLKRDGVFLKSHPRENYNMKEKLEKQHHM